MKNEPEIVLSPKALQRLEELAEYLYEQTQSKHFVREDIDKISLHRAPFNINDWMLAFAERIRKNFGISFKPHQVRAKSG